MSRRAIAWAATHDWFMHEVAQLDGTFHAVCNDSYTLNGILYEGEVTFSSLTEMRAWAGY